MIGILPCAGSATRIHGIPKFLLPMPDGPRRPGGAMIDVLLHDMRDHADLEHILIGASGANYEWLRKRWRPNTFLYQVETKTMSETVLLARPYLEQEGYGNENIIMAMPDTYMDNHLILPYIGYSLANNGYDVCVALFKARPGQHRKAGMCRLSTERNHILDEHYPKLLEVVDKPEVTDLEYLWGAIAWKPVFWDYIHADDPHVGYALPRAIEAGLDVRGFDGGGEYWDAGTPEEYFELVRFLTTETTTPAIANWAIE